METNGKEPEDITEKLILLEKQITAKDSTILELSKKINELEKKIFILGNAFSQGENSKQFEEVINDLEHNDEIEDLNSLTSAFYTTVNFATSKQHTPWV